MKELYDFWDKVYKDRSQGYHWILQAAIEVSE